MSDTSTVDEFDRKVKLEEFYFQRRILFGCTVSLFAAVILWIVAISTNHWFIVTGGGQGIFVESHRRFFKSSHTGIWRNCRYAVVPQPISSSVVRNFTTLAVSMSDLPQQKAEFAKEKFVDDFLKAELNETEAINTIDENFRQQLFGHWVTKNERNSEFQKLRNRLWELIVNKPRAQRLTYLDPSNFEDVNESIGDLITNIEFNKTHHIYVVVPEALREVLFKDWEENGLRFIRLLSHFAKSLEIDLSIYKDDTKYVFKPPAPPKNKKNFNGFLYNNWKRCTYHNLFADKEAIKADPSVDEDMIDLSRTAATFSIITFFVMSLGFVFTVYTFMNPRYMFKRLAGGIHFIAGLTSATVCRVLDVSVHHAKDHLSYAFPDGANYTYGYGFYFGILVAIINFFSCLMFFWYSKKKKGNKAATEELGMADEPIEIGR